MSNQVTHEEFQIEMANLRTEIHKENSATARLMIGVIVTVWAVTLLTASTLYLITN